jgi:hypothetical protein
MKFSRGKYLYRRKQTSSLTGEAWRIQKGMLEGQKTMNSIPPWGRQGAHYTQQENKSQRYVSRGQLNG